VHGVVLALVVRQWNTNLSSTRHVSENLKLENGKPEPCTLHPKSGTFHPRPYTLNIIHHFKKALEGVKAI
jgi:hypothetical protein